MPMGFKELKHKQTIKSIFNVLIVIAMLISGASLFHSEDTRAPDQGKLREAILEVRALAQAARNDASFAIEVKKALASLRMAAGLQTVFQAESGDQRGLISKDAPFIGSCYGGRFFSRQIIADDDIIATYLSFIAEIIPPPPRMATCIVSQKNILGSM